jgi:hypothetical protein
LSIPVGYVFRETCHIWMHSTVVLCFSARMGIIYLPMI